MIKPPTWDENLPMEISMLEAKGLPEGLHKNGSKMGGVRNMDEVNTPLEETSERLATVQTDKKVAT